MGPGAQGPASLLGSVVGGYRLTRVLGKGATGVVFLGERTEGAARAIEKTGAEPTLLPDQAAIKMLVLPWQLDDAERIEYRKRFLREAETLSALSHPHILSVITYGGDQGSGSSYIVLPYLTGGTLHDRLTWQTQPMALEEASSVLSQVADALDYAHSQGIVHRDIKPGNILLDGQGQAYLSDLSIAHLVVEATTRLTHTGMALGTPVYMSPEALAGQAVGPAADIYSLGMVLYELVTGLRTNATNPPPAPRTLRFDLPVPAEAVILKAIASNPADRFSSAGELARAFAEGVQSRWAPGLTAHVPGAKAGGVGDPHEAVTEPAGNGAPLPHPRKLPRPHLGVLATAALFLFACTVITVGLASSGASILAGPFSLLGPGDGHATATALLARATSTSGHAARPTATHTWTSSSGGDGPVQPHATPTHTPRPTPTFTPTPTVTPTITPTPVPPTYAETSGGVAHTWTNYMNAGGYQGPSVSAYQTIQIACALTGFQVADGNPWWYRIAQSPWSNQYYVSADAFYNNGATSGSLKGTPWVDPKVRHC